MTLSSHRTIVLQDQALVQQNFRITTKKVLQCHNERVIDEPYFLPFFWSYFNDVTRIAEKHLTRDYEEHGTAECKVCGRHVIACAPYYSANAGECYRCLLSRTLNSEYEMSAKEPHRDPFLASLFADYAAFYKERVLEFRGSQEETAAVVVRSQLKVNPHELVHFQHALCPNCRHIAFEDNVFTKSTNGLHWYHDPCGESFTLEELQIIPGLSRSEKTYLNR